MAGSRRISTTPEFRIPAMNVRQSRNVTAAFALLPVVALWIWKTVLYPRPFWIHYFDPETSYFYEGLRIVSGQSPHNVDNPGTPVQLVSALISLFTGASPLTYSSFLVVAHAFGLVLSCGAAFLLMQTLLRAAPPAIAVAAIWTWFLSPQALEYQLVWSPEMFFFGLGSLALVAIAKSLSQPAHARRDAFAGAAIGVLIATKFVFVAWLAARWVAYLVARERTIVRTLISAGGAAGAFILTTAVAWPRYPAMGAWLARLALNSGLHGRGSRGLPQLSDVLDGYAQTILTSKAWMLWLIVVMVCGVRAYRRGARTLVVFAGTASLFVAMMAIRAPAFRYLMPIALCAVLIVALSDWRPLVLCTVAGLLLAKSIARDVGDHRARVESVTSIRSCVERALPAGVVVYSWRFSTPSFALRINATNDRQRNEIAGRFPREGHYNDWTGQLFLPPAARRWDALVIDEALLPGFPEPVGRTVARCEQFRVVLPPDR